MKRINLFLLTLMTCGASLASCHPGRGNASSAMRYQESTGPDDKALTGFANEYPVFSVAEKSFDFDTVSAGDSVAHGFTFKNTGSKPLIIHSASSTCGCTVPSYPTSPIRPGEQGVLKVVFHTAGKSGHQEKPIFITANTMPASFQLKITAEVLPRKRTIFPPKH